MYPPTNISIALKCKVYTQHEQSDAFECNKTQKDKPEICHISIWFRRKRDCGQHGRETAGSSAKSGAIPREARPCPAFSVTIPVAQALTTRRQSNSDRARCMHHAEPGPLREAVFEYAGSSAEKLPCFFVSAQGLCTTAQPAYSEGGTLTKPPGMRTSLPPLCLRARTQAAAWSWPPGSPAPSLLLMVMFHVCRSLPPGKRYKTTQLCCAVLMLAREGESPTPRKAPRSKFIREPRVCQKL